MGRKWISPAFIVSCLLITGVFTACADEPKEGSEEEAKMGAIELKSEAFKQGETIPVKYTCDDADVSPALTWSQPPEGTKELVLICDDPDAPMRTWDHWVLYGLPADTAGLPEGVPKTEEIESGGVHGKNSWGNLGYGGPCPPKGTTHRYFFKIYAIDKKLNLESGAVKKEVLSAIEGHILAQGELMGKYAR
jgi:Raf kinase inhibitor-like YbhB/YbcL family protein